MRADKRISLGLPVGSDLALELDARAHSAARTIELSPVGPDRRGSTHTIELAVL